MCYILHSKEKNEIQLKVNPRCCSIHTISTSAMADYTFVIPKSGGGTSVWAEIIATTRTFLRRKNYFKTYSGARDIPDHEW